MHPQALKTRQSLLRHVIHLSPRPERALARVAALFISIEVVLILLHLATRAYAAQLFAGDTADGHIGGFDLADEANLAVWFSSFQLLLLALVCLGLSWLDRGGAWPRIRVLTWSGSALVFLLMAIDETSGLHEIFGKGMAYLLPGLPLSSRMWGMLPYALIITAALTAIGLRFLPLPKYLAGIATGWLLWVLGQGADQIDLFGAEVNIVVEEGLEMLGATTLLLTLAHFTLGCAQVTSIQAEPDAS